jgi:DNA-binding MarR family transcriptional regulator
MMQAIVHSIGAANLRKVRNWSWRKVRNRVTLRSTWALGNFMLRTVGEKSALATSRTEQMSDNLLMRARLLSKAITAIYDDELRPLEISSAQFALLSAICRTEPVTRAEIARLQHLNRSTLTRDLKAILSEGWIEEVRENADGRSRPIALTRLGRELILNAQPALRAAQAQAEALLGKDCMIAIVNIADRIMDQQTSVGLTQKP